MCKEELNQEVELDEDMEMEDLTLEDMDKDQLIDVITQLMEMRDREIEINTDNIQGIEVDEQEYKAGVQSMSFLVGQISVLKASGVSEDFIREMILNRETIEHNQTLQHMNNESSERIAKIQQTIQEQNQP